MSVPWKITEISKEGIELIKHFEGCRLKAYRDVVGILTIGYGHTGDDVKEALEVSQEEAERLLILDLKRFCDGVFDLVEIPVTSNQFSALVSFSYNLGLGSLEHSTLLKLVNQREFELASKEFSKWAKAGGKSVPGLVKRREAERALFCIPSH